LIHTVPLPKIGLQYLSEVDLLKRYMELTQVDNLENIRKDLEQTINAMEPVRTLSNETIFMNQQNCPFGIPIFPQSFQIVHIGKPKIHHIDSIVCTSQVEAIFEIELTEEKRNVCFQPQECLFFVFIKATKDQVRMIMMENKQEEEKKEEEEEDTSFCFYPEDNGIFFVRCGHFLEMRDEKGHIVYQREEEDNQVEDIQRLQRGRKRQVKILLDPIQYQKDLEAQCLDQYEQINLLVRRPFERNQFKNILDNLQKSLQKSLFSKQNVLPRWLDDFYLGYTTRTPPPPPSTHTTTTTTTSSSSSSSSSTSGNNKLKKIENKLHLYAQDDHVLVDFVKQQIVHNGNGQQKRMLLMTKTSAKLKETLNCLMKDRVFFEEHGHEIVHLSIENYNQKENKEFSVKGRIDVLLQKRLQCLQKAAQLAKCIEQEQQSITITTSTSTSTTTSSSSSMTSVLSDSTSYSCENALFFYQMYLRPLYYSTKSTTCQDLSNLLKRMMQEFNCKDIHALWKQVDNLFELIQQLEMFERLRSPRQRHEMYLLKHAKVILMTSTQAAASAATSASFNKNKNALHKMKFHSLVIQESDQLTEVDALIPFFFTCQELEQIILFGKSGTNNNNQSETEVQEQMLKEKCHLDQSQFTRFQRLGLPVHEIKK
jgi:hypothetical protein